MSHRVRPSVPRSQQTVLDDGLQVVGLFEAGHGKEVVPNERLSGSQKQMVFSEEEKEPVEASSWQGQPPVGLYESHIQPQQPTKKSRYLIILAVLVFIVLAVVIAAVVAVVEVRKGQSSQNQR